MEDQGKRIVMFVAIAAMIFFGWTYLFPQEKPQPKKPAATQAAETQSKLSPVWKVGVAEGSPMVLVEDPGVPEQTLELSAKNLTVTFSNIGGVVKRVQRGHDPLKGQMNDDLFVSSYPGIGFMATTFVESTYPLAPRAVWTGEKLADGRVQYTIKVPGKEGGEMVVTKVYELVPEEWIVKLTIDAKVPEGKTKASQQLVVSMFGMAPDGVAGQPKWQSRPQATCNVGGAVRTRTGKGIGARGPFLDAGNVRYFGSATSFFMFGVSPKRVQGEPDYGCNQYALPIEGVLHGVQVDLVYPPATGDGTIHKELVAFIGPKYLDKLEGADRIAGYPTGFKDSIDFGWFGFISRPLLWLLRNIFNFVGNWGIAIILLTFLVKLATLYWTQKSMKSMRAMSALKPEMDAIQKKYPDDRQKQQQAQMELFKRHGVNPLSGCLPMLLQMPIWMGLYRMLSHVGELHQAVFIPGWLDDLTVRDPYYILPIALTGLMFLQSRIQPATTTDSMQQKMIMYGMPLMFGVMGLWFPSGLTVYITTNTVLGILHSLYMKRTAPPLPAAKSVEKKVEPEEAKPAKKPARAEASDDDGDADDSDAADEGDAGDDEAEDARPAPRASAPRPAAGGPGQQQRRGKRRTKRR